MIGAGCFPNSPHAQPDRQHGHWPLSLPDRRVFSSAESQPFYVNSPYGICLAHNGNLTNTEELLKSLCEADLRHINTSSDSEALLNVLAHHLQILGKLSPTSDDFFDAVSEVHRRCKGAYAVVALISGHGMLAFRDPNGIRPLYSVNANKMARRNTWWPVNRLHCRPRGSADS